MSDSHDSGGARKRLTGPVNKPVVVMPNGWKAKLTAKKRNNDDEPVLLFKIWNPAMPDCSAFMEFPVKNLVDGLTIDISAMMAAAFGL